MTWRITRVAALGGALALHAGAVHAHEPSPGASASRPVDPMAAEAPRKEGGSPELRGRLEASPRRLLLELGGNALELTLDGAPQTDEELRSRTDPSGGHELRARVTVGNTTTHVALRLSIESESAAPDVPPSEPETAPPTR